MKIADALNKGCACKTLDTGLLKTQLEKDPLLQGLFDDIVKTRPNLFSATTVFLGPKELDAMKELITVIEKIINLPEFQKIIFERSPEISRTKFGPEGVFMGYDFHMSDEGPKLIEINTNAGGGLLNLELAKAQQACCLIENAFFKSDDELLKLDTVFCEMFIAEWRKQRESEKPGLLAIIDNRPEEQYLYPEFVLFKRLLTESGINTVILDPSQVKWEQNKLWFENQSIDMIYNRLTDFYFEEESNRAIREAYQSGAVVVTPAPHHHALYANKFNLVTLTDEKVLTALSISPEDRLVLARGIPATKNVSSFSPDEMWNDRKNLFFKPVSGFGGKATYRGDKLTRKVWGEILESDYVAQKIIPPSQRVIQQGDTQTDLKIDIRAYVYQGKIQLLASRLYAGQTTNFRTTGGGFAPVFIVKEEQI